MIGEIWPYLFAFATLVAAGFGLPVPEELALAGAGVASAVPGADADTPAVLWYIMLPVCILGVLIADLGLYGVGRWYGDKLLQHRWVARLIRPNRRKRIETNFHEYGITILLFGRLIPGIRAPLFLTAGTIRLPLSRFLFADALGAVLGNTLFFFLGFWLGSSFMTMLNRLESLKPLVFFCVAVAIITFFIREFWRHPVSTGDPEEMPVIGHQVAQVAHHIKETIPGTDAVPQTDAPKGAEPKSPEGTPAGDKASQAGAAGNGQAHPEVQPHEAEPRSKP